MREHSMQVTRRTTKAAAVLAVGLSAAIGTLILTATPVQACPGHGSDMHAHVPRAEM